MKSAPNFDGDLEMFREPPRTANVDYLRFLRWLVEQGRLEHLPAGSPAGEFALAADGVDSAERELALVAEG
jgi:hypothetical protein